jgi:hypothetical protein
MNTMEIITEMEDFRRLNLNKKEHFIILYWDTKSLARLAA